MPQISPQELVGYAASALVVLALTRTSLRRLRMLSLCGALVFCTYGFLIESIPILITNCLIAIINLRFLWRAYRQQAYFSLLPIKSDSKYLKEFLEFYADEIRNFQPSFDGAPEPEDLVVFLLKDLVPAGLFIGRPVDDPSVPGQVLDVRLDFATPAFRDFQLGRYLYGQDHDFLVAQGFSLLRTNPGTPIHRRYLERMRFVEHAERMELPLG